MTPELPLVTVAILAYNRREQLAVTVETITERLAYPRQRLEVIVVDNASTDGTAEMVRERFPDLQLIVNTENEGISGWNRAFDRGRGTWFLVLDDDCYIEGDALQRAIVRAERHEADLVSFRVESSAGGAFSEWYQGGVFSFWGCSALVSARAIRELGGFDPGIFLYSHELEFTMRLLDRGMTHLVLPEVSSVHLKPIPALNRATYARTMRSYAYIAAKLMQPRDLGVAAVNLLLRPVLAAAVDRQTLGAVAAVVEGLGEGARARAPVRPEVSRLYRRNYIEFGSPVRLIRGPLQRRRDRRRRGPLFTRVMLFWEKRRPLYPLDRPVAFKVP